MSALDGITSVFPSLDTPMRWTEPAGKLVAVKPGFKDLDIDLWVHPGKLGVTQPSVCLFHESRDTGAKVLETIAELAGDPPPAHRSITFHPCSRPGALRRLNLKLDVIGDDLKIMHISVGPDRDTATIRMTKEGLSLLTRALRTWLDGGEDFGVSPRHSALKPKAFGKLDKESGELWFWGPGYAGP